MSKPKTENGWTATFEYLIRWPSPCGHRTGGAAPARQHRVIPGLLTTGETIRKQFGLAMVLWNKENNSHCVEGNADSVVIY